MRGGSFGTNQDLKRMTMKESALKQKGLIAQKEIRPAIERKETVSPQAEQKNREIPTPQFLKEKTHPPEKTLDAKPISEIAAPPVEEKIEAKIPKPAEEIVWDIPINIVEDPIIEEVQIVEEEMILPAEAVEILTDFARAEPVDDKLKIELLNEASFKGGERKTISILVKRGANAEEGLSGAHVLVKVIGSSFRPLIFHARTDSQGVAVVHLQLPHFKAGRAAVLVKAMSEGEEAELRRVILQG